ncbi:MAG: EAL domain-containing protein [Proteobacteria bacterium]|nr:EAL domain-containing protein [Pseudomonadota bacterium]NOG61088.1 EAL domain-containing protein [Pseudomonadota bacterium]
MKQNNQESSKQLSKEFLYFGRNMALGFSALLLTFMLIVILVGSIIYTRVSDSNESELQETVTSLLAQSINRISFSGKYHARLLVEQIAATHSRIVFITIALPDGKIIANSQKDNDSKYVDEHNINIIQHVLEENKTVFEERHWNELTIRQIAMPYRSGYKNKASGVIIVGISIDEAIAAKRTTVYSLIILVLILSVVFFVITLLLSKHFATPVLNHAWQFKRILDHAPLLLRITDRDGKIKESSAEFSSLSRDDSKILDTELKDVLENNSEIEREITRTVGGKEAVFFSTSFPVLEDKGGEINLICTIAMDITNLRRTEAELHKLSRAVEHSSSSVYITDPDGKIEYVNPSFCEVTGYSKEEVLGMNPGILKSGQTTKEVYKDLWHTIESGENWKGELYNRKKDGNFYWARISISCVKDSNNEIINFVAIQDDVTREYQLSEQLNHQASHDDLTGLVNRREFERRTERLLNTSRTNGAEHALCFMDLDQFKVINDTCGHIAGDELLRQISTKMDNVVRKRDTLARLGGDEFGVLMEHCSLQDANRVATCLQKEVQEFNFFWQEKSFKIGVSMGLVVIKETTANLTELLKAADAACYIAKEKGRNRIHIYHEDDAEQNRRHGEMQWVFRLNQALEENRFCLFAQSIMPLDGRGKLNYELLIRMIDENGELIQPGSFLPAAERYNLISKLDEWVINNAFELLSNNLSFLDQINYCSINLSGPSISNSDVLDFIIYKLDEYKIDRKKICFEITETAAISNLNMAMHFISKLKGLGCKFALDDFGSGLSSFGYLKNLPVDYLKIDGMFVKDIADDPIDHAMVKSINEIGHVMHMNTIAEFVENDVIKGMLKEIGVDYAQGYGIGKPVEFSEILARTNNVVNIQPYNN